MVKKQENTHIQRGIAAAERMQEVMLLKPNIQDKHEAIELKTHQESIEFDDVWFRYNEITGQNDSNHHRPPPLYH